MGVFTRIFKPKQEIDVLKSAVKDSFGRVSTDVQQIKHWIIHLHQSNITISQDHHIHKNKTAEQVDALTKQLEKLESDQKQFATYFSQLIEYLQQKHDQERKFGSELEHKFTYELNKFKSELELIKHRRETSSEYNQNNQFTGTKFEPKSELELNLHAKEPQKIMRTFEEKNIEKKQEISRNQDLQKTANSTTHFEDKLLQKFRAHRKEYVLQKMMDLLAQELLSTNELEEIIVKQKEFCGRTTFFSYLKELKLQGLIEESLIGKRKVLALRKRILKSTHK